MRIPPSTPVNPAYNLNAGILLAWRPNANQSTGRRYGQTRRPERVRRDDEATQPLNPVSAVCTAESSLFDFGSPAALIGEGAASRTKAPNVKKWSGFAPT